MTRKRLAAARRNLEKTRGQRKGRLFPGIKYSAEWHFLYSLRKYKITFEDYMAKLLEQQGKCAICGRPIDQLKIEHKRGLCVDHNHETNKFRGLLCGTCNSGLGLFQESLRILRAAVAYMERAGESDK